MNDRETQFMEYAEGIRSADEVLDSEADPIDAQSFREFRALLALEQVIASIQPTVSDDISEQILAPWNNENELPTPLTIPAHQTPHTSVVGHRMQRCLHGLIAANITLLVVLCTLVFQGYSADRNALVTHSIPSGYALLALELPWEAENVRPYDHVDLKVSYQNQEQEVVRDLARFLPVHSISSIDDSDIAHTRIAVLVPQAQIEKIHIARILGNLEISPVRTSSDRNFPEKSLRTKKRRVLQDPFGREIVVDAPQQPQVLYLDRGSARVASRLVYHQGSWIEDPQVRIRAF